MKKILFVFFLVLSIDRTNAVSIEITKLTAGVINNFDATTNYKDSIVSNRGTLTTNLFPINDITLHAKWKDFDVISGPFDQTIYFNVYQYTNPNGQNPVTERLASLPHIIVSSDGLDSSRISFSPTIYLNANVPWEYSYEFKIIVTYFDSQNIERVITESNIMAFSIIDDPNEIFNNLICCSEIVEFPFTATDSLEQMANTSIYTNVQSKIKYIWQQMNAAGNWITISSDTNAKYLPPPNLTKTSYFRRIAIVNRGLRTESYSISNEVSIGQYICSYPDPGTNTICNDQAYFNLQNGDIINPTMIKGSQIEPPRGRERGFDYFKSVDGGKTWTIVQKKETVRRYAHNTKTNYTIPAITFDISKGNIQEIYYYRDFYQYYDPWDCGPGKIPFPCGKKFLYLNSSNTVTITLTSLGAPKPVADSITNETGFDKATCSYSSQTMTFSVPRVNNSETYKWEIPAGWIAYTALEGPYVNSITVSTNSGGANYAKGGNVCLTIKQPGRINSMCKHIEGSKPFSVNLPTVLTACEGSEVIVTPVVFQNNVAQSLSNYNFHWEAYQTPVTECIPLPTKYDNSCKQLKITVGNVYQNPMQPIKVTAINDHACAATATTNLTTSPGLQMGILNSFADPKVNSTSNLALNEYSNQLYFTSVNGTIQRAYFDDNVNQNIWRYAELKDKNTNFLIKATGSVAFYRDGISDKLFYVNGGNIYYAETIDNGATWTNVNNAALATGVGNRIKINGNNIYYLDVNSNKVFYRSLFNVVVPIPAGNAGINYSQDMFTVEEGILAYADQNNNIVAFDAFTGATLPINIAANLKAVTYNSAISIYNKNIYYVSTSGTLRILQKSATSNSYTAYTDVANQLAGPFTINRQTGTVYAKANDVAGKQIYFLNNQWTITPIKNYLQGSPVQSSMIYGNGHAYYIGTNGLVSNTFYIAPCVPNVLRTSGPTFAVNGDAANDLLPVVREEIPALTVYPNPAKDLVRVTFEIEKTSNIQIRLVSLTGNIHMLLNTSAEAGVQDIELPLESYSAGTYLLQLYVEGVLSASSKLVIY